MISFIWSWRHEIFVLFVFLAALLLRLQSFGDRHYYYQSDYNRDYLVAHHIVAYHEFPLTGPDGEFGSAGNSPAYFYFLALPLLIKDDIVFLGLFNVFLQMGALILLYLLAQSMFGKPVGLIAATLFGLTRSIVNQSNFIWQPWVMQPFLLLSFFLLYLAYARKNYGFLISSICIFLFSATLHQSVFALVPVYMLALFLILQTQHKQFSAYAGALLAFAGTFIMLHMPLLFYFAQNPKVLPSFSGSSQAFLTVDLTQLFSNLFSRVKIFWDFFLFSDTSGVLSPLFLSSFFVIGSIVYLCWSKEYNLHKSFTLIFFAALIQFFAVAIMVSVSPLIPFPVRYFTPLFGIVILCMAEIIHGLIPKKNILWSIEVFLIALLVFAFSPNLTERVTNAVHAAVSDPTDFFLPHYVTPPFIATVQNEIVSVKERMHKQDIHFFSVRTYRFGREDPFSNEVFWAPLEKGLHVPLVVLDDNAQRDYRPIGDAEYLFISCGYVSDTNRECTNPFLREHPDFRITKELTSDPPIYVAQRIL